MNQFKEYNDLCKAKKLVDKLLIISILLLVAVAGFVTGYIAGRGC